MNCVVIDDDKLSRKVVESYIERTDFLTFGASYPSAIDAINNIKKNEPVDLIFLDIEMPEMSGMEFLNSLNTTPQIIIISSKEQYALEAFEYDVTDYLLKPISYSRFFKAANKANKRYKNSEGFIQDKNEIFIKSNSSLVRLNYDDILWIEALENYVVVNTYQEKYTIHFTMKAIEEKMPAARFSRIHRSYIVNLSKIEMIEDNSVIIDTDGGPKSIPIGKSYRDKLMGDINLMTR
ncbi:MULTISPECIES: LytTR family DNA-binding domain-containing protein [Marinifilum]|jgi:DNA-binding LytR/AlgR family response regulator|uniref:LytTR family two component transcriptional regulator n=1 Tax=Marinifilum flexuosum TaxID=1117708 RepID=A0A419XA89_9BACT|nr:MULTISPECIES: LytTR family DNA-binding domain-containing protein [Marinifilum]MCY1636613.1 LytTR family DNA-binding domain-containing protein [Marinifilum sp. D737]MDQ2178849.1 LytTR family DNA-binding domain-containing protein [Marinifilum sp. D714]RKE04479.1 LytTR family two component transcriptional regulator [Marinifilum flexuosum]